MSKGRSFEDEVYRYCVGQGKRLSLIMGLLSGKEIEGDLDSIGEDAIVVRNQNKSYRILWEKVEYIVVQR